MTFKIGSFFYFLHAKFYFDIQHWAKYHFFAFFLYSSWDQISLFYIQILILPSILGQISLFFTFKILFSISKLGWILFFFFTFFDIWIGNKYRFFHLESYFDIQIDIQNWSIYRLLYIQKSILTFETGPNITFLHFWYCYLAKYRFYTVSDILLRTKYRIFTIQIQDCAEYHFFFKIQNPILTFKMGWILFFNNFFDILIGINCRLFSFEIIFWHSKWVFFSFFFTCKILFWHSVLGQISLFYIFFYQIGIKYRFLHSNSYFDIQYWAKYLFLTFKILF